MVTIRVAVLDDADAIGAIWLEAFRVGYRGIIPNEAIARRTDEAAETYWRTVLSEFERVYFVTETEVPGDGVVGFAQAGPCAHRRHAFFNSCSSLCYTRPGHENG